jgi:hypothetical protein
VTSPITAFIDIVIAGANLSDLLGGTQARAADPDEPTLTGVPTTPVDMRFTPDGNHRSSRLPFIEIEHPIILPNTLECT